MKEIREIDPTAIDAALANVPEAEADPEVLQSNWRIRGLTLSYVWIFFLTAILVFLYGMYINYVSTYDLLQNTAISFAFFLLTELFFFTVVNLNYKFVDPNDIKRELLGALITDE